MINAPFCRHYPLPVNDLALRPSRTAAGKKHFLNDLMKLVSRFVIKSSIVCFMKVLSADIIPFQPFVSSNVWQSVFVVSPGGCSGPVGDWSCTVLERM